ncbi:hypothetical protein BV20DRAFT_650603 [Pilatotrama ljubarskyi]|nr:hypothetical protein BV20DRAFT_650603 [Pilatotrama ljubarskyi]
MDLAFRRWPISPFHRTIRMSERGRLRTGRSRLGMSRVLARRAVRFSSIFLPPSHANVIQVLPHRHRTWAGVPRLSAVDPVSGRVRHRDSALSAGAGSQGFSTCHGKGHTKVRSHRPRAVMRLAPLRRISLVSRPLAPGRFRADVPCPSQAPCTESP